MVNKTSITLVCIPKRICDYTLQNQSKSSVSKCQHNSSKKNWQRIASGVLAHVARVASLCKPGSGVATHPLDQRAITMYMLWKEEILWYPDCLLSCFSQSCNLGWIWPFRTTRANIKIYPGSSTIILLVRAMYIRIYIYIYLLNEEMARLQVTFPVWCVMCAEPSHSAPLRQAAAETAVCADLTAWKSVRSWDDGIHNFLNVHLDLLQI